MRSREPRRGSQRPSYNARVSAIRPNVVRVAVAEVALFVFGLTPGTMGKIFWDDFLLSLLVLIVLGIATVVRLRRVRAL